MTSSILGYYIFQQGKHCEDNNIYFKGKHGSQGQKARGLWLFVAIENIKFLGRGQTDSDVVHGFFCIYKKPWIAVIQGFFMIFKKLL